MVVFGIDTHKRTHTVVAVDATGRKLAERTLGTTSGEHLELLIWATTVATDPSDRDRPVRRADLGHRGLPASVTPA